MHYPEVLGMPSIYVVELVSEQSKRDTQLMTMELQYIPYFLE